MPSRARLEFTLVEAGVDAKKQLRLGNRLVVDELSANLRPGPGRSGLPLAAGARQRGPRSRPRSASSTFCARSWTLKGLWRKWTPGSRTPWLPITLEV